MLRCMYVGRLIAVKKFSSFSANGAKHGPCSTEDILKSTIRRYGQSNLGDSKFQSVQVPVSSKSPEPSCSPIGDAELLSTAVADTVVCSPGMTSYYVSTTQASTAASICPPQDKLRHVSPPEEDFARSTSSRKHKRFRKITFLLKSAVLGGIIYFTIDQGFWKDIDETIEIYHRAQRCFLECTCASDEDLQKPKEVPSAERLWYQIAQCWNKAVIFVFTGIVNLPSKIRELIRSMIPVRPPVDSSGKQEEEYNHMTHPLHIQVIKTPEEEEKEKEE